MVSFNALHWVRDLEAAFGQLRRACVDGAQLVVRMVGQGERRSLEQTLMDLAVSPRWRHALGTMEQPFDHRPPEELMAMVRAAGFDATLDVGDVAWDFGLREAFVAWGLGTMRPWTARLHEAEREAFVCDAVDRLAAAQREVGAFRFMQCCIRGVAIKEPMQETARPMEPRAP